MRLSLIIPAILIILLAIDLRVKIYFSYNFLKNIGRIKFKLFGITIFKSEISIVGAYFNFIRKNKKVIQIKINLNDNNLKLFKKIMLFYLQKIFVLTLKNDIYISGNNTYLVTMLGGGLRSVGGVFDTYMLSKNIYTNTNTNVMVGFYNNYFEIRFYTHILLNLFDFIWSVFTVIYKRSVIKYEKRKRCKLKRRVCK